MRKIHQLFIKSDQELVRRATIDMGRKALCWYPSAGDDFRHIQLLEEEGLNECIPSQPMLYIHTDMMSPMEWGGLSNPRIFKEGSFVAPNMQIKSIDRLQPKQILRKAVKEVYNGEIRENTGEVFLVVLDVQTKFKGRVLKIPTPILFFVNENLAFLVYVLIRFGLHVDTLVHIKDGGASLGGSKVPMNFIYQAAGIIKLKRVICDESPDAKFFRTRFDFLLLNDTLMKFYYSEGLGRRCERKLNEVTEDWIRGAWAGNTIEKNRLPHNIFSPPDGYYYDWRPKKIMKSKQNEPGQEF